MLNAELCDPAKFCSSHGTTGLTRSCLASGTGLL
jgi:hypothetical protein